MTWKRWLWRTAGAVVVLLVARTAWLVGEREWRRSAGETDYAAAVAETERTDPDWRWDDLNAGRSRPPVGRNGAEVIPKVKALAGAGWGKDLLGERLGRRSDLPPNVRYPDVVLAEARRELDGARAAVDLSRTLKDYPDEGFRELRLASNPFATPLEDTQDTRLVAAILAWDAAVAADDGRPDRAADALLAALHATRSIGDELFLISQLVRLATREVAAQSTERALAQASLTEPQLAGVQAAWAADAESPLLRYGLRGERVVLDHVLGHMIDGTLSYTEGLTGAPRPDPGGTFGQYAWWLYRGRLPRERAFLLRWFNGALEASGRPVHEQAAALDALPFYRQYATRNILIDFDPALTGEEKEWPVAHGLIRGTCRYPTSMWRSTARARCVVVGLACERYRLKHGRWPGSLAEMPKALLAAVPLDPFDGEPLRFRRLADGVVVYSVGENRADDAGDTRQAANPQGKDEGFRLWDPDHRRQPAPTGPPAEQDPPPEPEHP